MRPIMKTLQIDYILISEMHLINQNNRIYLIQQTGTEVQMIVCVSGPLFPHFQCLTDELFTYEGLNALSW
jgi:hypothetical protein